MTFHLLKTNLERRHGSFEVFVCAQKCKRMLLLIK
ncbi:hypothetical protein A406_2160 [Listeria monocytogenes serotype 4b str. 81-0592]|nr:hypothetical protein A408_2160 [Listeria monocytogenes serotype 4b str. 10-0809]ASH39027.1 hypothetical protein A410_2193 [Listeria monocytogenes serotype 1/2b str. 10-0811]ASH82282.1 hypothetical protein A406_2160 [Listeria monocytogenes serotype 4b str. 81-0592]CCO64648.1 hypothetical protein BN389_20740 [Listeria monocytogenes serotype 4b str. LL195]GAT37754.1 hypothetical protein SAMD00023518_02173 [Listeria monocytogenes]